MKKASGDEVSDEVFGLNVREQRAAGTMVTR
jgi:hypothetical protein